jgi:rhomboid-related protein 1/2/3
LHRWYILLNVSALQVGLPLEMVHGALRCGAVYLAGVLAGSLAASVLDPDVCLAGASGGVYALLAAHLANALLNFHAMRYGAVRLVAALAVASCDVGFAVHARYTKVSLFCTVIVLKFASVLATF